MALGEAVILVAAGQCVRTQPDGRGKEHVGDVDSEEALCGVLGHDQAFVPAVWCPVELDEQTVREQERAENEKAHHSHEVTLVG